MIKLNWRKRKPKIQYHENDSILDKLAAINGITDYSRYINPSYKELHEPYLLKNIDIARNRILQAIYDNEEIVVHADVDYDGAVACTIMYKYLKIFTENVSYIHSQRSIGHGIYNSIEDIPEFTDLLIIVDSSSDEGDACRRIKNMGIDIIILDHHEVQKSNDYCILVNPQQPDCIYPNKNTSGSLIAWKMCQVLDDTLGHNYADMFIDLAGTGLHSDQCNMAELENRYVVLKALDNIHNLGLKAILKVMGKDKKDLSSTDIAYSLTPFVNAGTRFDKLGEILELLTSDDADECLKIAKRMKVLNDERKQKQKESVKRLIAEAKLNDKCMVFIDESLGKGFNGLIASDLSNHFQRPVIVLGQNEDKIDEYHGSYRSFGFFNFLDFTKKIPQFLYSGGHPSAGGVGIKKTDLEKLKATLNKGLKNEKFEQVLYYDLEFDAEEINEDLIERIQQFYRVCGKGFYESKFLINDIYPLNLSVIGSGDTLKIESCPTSATWFIDDTGFDELTPTITLLKFKADEQVIEKFPVKETVSVVGSLNLNRWTAWKPRPREIKTCQIFIEDFKVQ